MSVEVYLGKRFDYSHERRALGRFLKNMYDCFEGNDELYFVVVEPQANRANIDLLLVSSSAIVIIEFKQLTQAEESERHQVHLLGKQNDVWNYHLPSGRTFNLGSPTKTRNPYRQTRDMRFELAKWIKDHARSFLGMQWSEHRTLNHVHAWVVVSPGFDGDMSDLDLPADDMEFGNSSYKWFQVIGIEDLAAEFDCAPDTDLNLSEVQMRGLIDELGVTRCANMQELMPGYIALAPLFSKPPEMKALVNRDAQRAELLEAVNNKHMSVILIEGIAGVGRTALAAWLVGEVNQRGYRVRWVDCREKTGTTLDSILTAISAEVTDLKRGLTQNPDQP